MCHHYVFAFDPPLDLASVFGAREELYQLPMPFGGVFPLAMVPAVRMNEQDERQLVGLEWGLLPPWWKPSSKSKSRKTFQRKCFNARQETVHEKPTYREAFKSRRCLLPATEFMEKGHYFHLQDKKPFAFAGLWQRWQSEGETLETCTMLTTEPNELVKSVGHHRMPVLLADEEAYSRWLDVDATERGQLEDLLRPFDPVGMECYLGKAEGGRGSGESGKVDNGKD